MNFFLKSSRRNKIAFVYVAAAVLLFASLIIGVSFGSTRVGISDAFRALLGERETPEARIIILVRLPRTLAALLAGAALSLSGAVLQGVLANNLASPSVVGVNSGAGLAVTLAVALGTLGGWRLSLAAFIGALLAVGAVSLAARKWGASRGTVILIGVAMNSFLGAISDTVVTLTPDVGVMSNDFKVGSFSSVTYTGLIPAAVIILASSALLMTFSNELDVLTLGEDSARSLGMNTRLYRSLFLIITAMLAGAAVSLAGLLSFVGLIVPHAVRRLFAASSRHLLPLSGMLGGAFVATSDTLARVVFAPYEIPVGIIMAFLGAPFFIFILIKGKGER